jgi:hypothetical protein
LFLKVYSGKTESISLGGLEFYGEQHSIDTKKMPSTVKPAKASQSTERTSGGNNAADGIVWERSSRLVWAVQVLEVVEASVLHDLLCNAPQYTISNGIEINRPDARKRVIRTPPEAICQASQALDLSRRPTSGASKHFDYFEVTITYGHRHCALAVGLASGTFPLAHEMPGWRTGIVESRERERESEREREHWCSTKHNGTNRLIGDGDLFRFICIAQR